MSHIPESAYASTGWKQALVGMRDRRLNRGQKLVGV
jgi:hypothetical protein